MLLGCHLIIGSYIVSQVPSKEQVDSLAQELRNRAKIPGSFSFEVKAWYVEEMTVH